MDTTPSSAPPLGTPTASDDLGKSRAAPDPCATPVWPVDARAHGHRPDHLHERALVLAGAGAAGNAWELGVVAGLGAAGVDLTVAELIVGTSAGATVAAQITSGTRPDELYAAVFAEVPPSRAGANPGRGLGSGRGAAPDRGPASERGLTSDRGSASDQGPAPDRRPAADRAPAPVAAAQGYLEWSDAVIAAAADPTDMRRRMGATALGRAASADCAAEGSAGSGQSRWRDIVAARLPRHQWPDQRVLITAVDAQTGEPVVFDRHSGVALVDAVAASTSNGAGPFGAYRVGERRYLNGGYRRSENADLAAGYGRVLVLSPFGGRSRMPPAWGMDLATQVAELRVGGSRVETVFPDSRAGDVFNVNAADPSTRPQAARGGYAQGSALADQLAAFWR